MDVVTEQIDLGGTRDQVFAVLMMRAASSRPKPKRELNMRPAAFLFHPLFSIRGAKSDVKATKCCTSLHVRSGLTEAVRAKGRLDLRFLPCFEQECHNASSQRSRGRSARVVQRTPVVQVRCRDLLVGVCATGVSDGDDGGTPFTVPGEATMLRRGSDGQCVDRADVTITVAIVTGYSTVSRRPHEDYAPALSSFYNSLKESLLSQPLGPLHCSSIVRWSPRCTVDINVLVVER